MVAAMPEAGGTATPEYLCAFKGLLDGGEASPAETQQPPPDAGAQSTA